MEEHLRGVLGWKGERGYSAYEVAVRNGYIGSEKDWLSSLGTTSHFSEDSTVHIATENQASFDLPATYVTDSMIDIYVNGFKLNPNEYTIDTDTMKINLVAALDKGAVVELVVKAMGTNKIRIMHYNSVSSMKLDITLENANMVHTLGYYAVNDGGAADYRIREKTEDDVEDNGSIHFLDNGLVAELIMGDSVNVKQFGAKGDGVTDDTIAIEKVLNKYDNIYIPKGTYICKSNIVINTSKLKIYGDGRNHSIIDFGGTGSIEFTSHNIVLEDLEINKAKYVRLKGHSSTINKCAINYGEIGLHLINGFITQILNCYITFNKIGVAYDHQSYESIIDNCVIDNNDIGVIYNGSSTGGRITNSTIEGNRDKTTNIGCGIVISTMNTDVKIDKCWFEANGESEYSADIFFNSQYHNPSLDNLFNTIKEKYPEIVPQDCGGLVAIESSQFLYTQYGVAVGGAESKVYIKGNSFKGVIDKYNKAVDIYGMYLTANSVICVANKIFNTDNRTIDTQMLNGVKGTYVYTSLNAKENEVEKLINGVITIDGEPLFLYKGKLSELTNIKYLYQYQGANEGATYNAGILNGLNGSHLTNSYSAKSGAIYLTDTKGTNKPVFTSTGNTEFIVIGTPNSEINFRYGENTPTVIKPLNYDMFRINRFNLYSKEAFAQNINQVFFALIELTDEEKIKMKQCLAFKPLDYHYSIINNGSL